MLARTRISIDLSQTIRTLQQEANALSLNVSDILCIRRTYNLNRNYAQANTFDVPLLKCNARDMQHHSKLIQAGIATKNLPRHCIRNFSPRYGCCYANKACIVYYILFKAFLFQPIFQTRG